jgi:hypothetical protein
MCAEAILASIKVLEDPLFKTRPFMEMISHRDSSLQLVCLKVRRLDNSTKSRDFYSFMEFKDIIPITFNMKNRNRLISRAYFLARF